MCLPVAPSDKVAPGKTVTYKWLVPERAGPGPDDMSSVLWMYHSHVNEAADPAAGLVGGIIITTPDNANEDATPSDVKRWAYAVVHDLPFSKLLSPCSRSCAVGFLFLLCIGYPQPQEQCAAAGTV